MISFMDIYLLHARLNDVRAQKLKFSREAREKEEEMGKPTCQSNMTQCGIS